MNLQNVFAKFVWFRKIGNVDWNRALNWIDTRLSFTHLFVWTACHNRRIEIVAHPNDTADAPLVCISIWIPSGNSDTCSAPMSDSIACACVWRNILWIPFCNVDTGRCHFSCEFSRVPWTLVYSDSVLCKTDIRIVRSLCCVFACAWLVRMVSAHVWRSIDTELISFHF